jgi:glycosyltransferase involved in cell wall biosynthesis
LKVLRIISRLNIGGPAIHVQQLTTGLNPDRFESILIVGKISRHEGDMGFLFDDSGITPRVVPELQREINLFNDIVAFGKILRILFEEKPDILHSHAAKAGTVRLAAFFYGRMLKRRIKTVHTFHGNVFDGYFGKLKSKMFIGIERTLSKMTDAVIAISDSQKDDLAYKYRIADPDRIRKIELGFELAPFLNCALLKGKLRTRLVLKRDRIVIGIVGRLVPIKNHKLFFDAARRLVTDNPEKDFTFLIVGDGELRGELETYLDDAGLRGCVEFLGWVKNVPEIYADLDMLALTSVNEGTPVSIIEGMAAAVPVVATDAGGVKDLLGKPTARQNENGFMVCERGLLCPQNDAETFSRALTYQLNSRKKETEGRLAAARDFVAHKYSSDRLIRDIEALYLELMGSASA